MKRLSLHARFVALSAITALATLLVAGYALGEVVRTVVMDGTEEIFLGQQELMFEAVDPDGTFHPERVVFLREFADDPEMWGWSLSTPTKTWQSGTTAEVVELARSAEEGGGHLQLALGRTPQGNPVHIREWTGHVPAGPVRIVIVGPDSLFDVPFRESRTILFSALGIVAMAILVIVVVQLKFGFAPLREVRRELAEVREGRSQHLSLDLPEELRPLAREINALIDQKEAGLAHARVSLANIAHGLKTPLATLSLRLEREGSSAKALDLVRQIDTRISHHLARARSAALSSDDRDQCNVALAASPVCDVLSTLHAGRKLEIENRVDPSIEIAVDGEDLSEMLGNLLENACRFARRKVVVSAQPKGRRVSILVEDDGPGLEGSQMEAAMAPGERLDDRSHGFGLGLGLVRELAILYDGDLVLMRSESLGGLKAQLDLPHASRPSRADQGNGQAG